MSDVDLLRNLGHLRFFTDRTKGNGVREKAWTS
jgi:hypothetical protein